MLWPPHITVATIIENKGRFLFVEEKSDGKHVLNQPAGHLEPEESLINAAIRETLEETSWRVEITSLIGIYVYHAPNKIIYHRYCFSATPVIFEKDNVRDSDILHTHWLTPDELKEHPCPTRSPLVLSCLNDYLNEIRYPLALIREHG